MSNYPSVDGGPLNVPVGPGYVLRRVPCVDLVDQLHDYKRVVYSYRFHDPGNWGSICVRAEGQEPTRFTRRDFDSMANSHRNNTESVMREILGCYGHNLDISPVDGEYSITDYINPIPLVDVVDFGKDGSRNGSFLRKRFVDTEEFGGVNFTYSRPYILAGIIQPDGKLSQQFATNRTRWQPGYPVLEEEMISGTTYLFNLGAIVDNVTYALIITHSNS